MKIQKTKQIIGGYDDQIEKVRGLIPGVGDTLKNELFKKSLGTMWEQVGGDLLGDNGQSGDLSEGQEIDLKKTEKKEHLDIDPSFDYRREILHAERRISGESDHQIKV